MNRIHWTTSPAKFNWIFILMMTCLGFIIGCKDRVGAKVDLTVAQNVLAAAMEGWKTGKTPKELVEGNPSIFVQELEWNNGTTLLDYEIVNDQHEAGPNLVATVKLKMSKPDGSRFEKMATYVVGTSPSLTVYRNMMK